jgi:hypothetical protein
MSFFPTIITKEILKGNVTLANFVGMIATIVTRRYDGCSQVHHFNP